MRRRGVGIGAVHKKQQEQKQYEKVGSQMAANQLVHVKEQLAAFKLNLEQFAIKYKNNIKKDPEFRKQFQLMCAKIGVDPLASNKGFWSELLDFGDFYYELAVQIIDVCIVTRPRNGGLICMSDLLAILEKKRGSNFQKISEDDVKRSVLKLRVLGEGFQVVELGSKTMIVTVPVELSVDHSILLESAQSHQGCLNNAQLEKELQWDKQRIELAIQVLLKEGMVWIDNQTSHGESDFYFPSIIFQMIHETIAI